MGVRRLIWPRWLITRCQGTSVPAGKNARHTQPPARLAAPQQGCHLAIRYHGAGRNLAYHSAFIERYHGSY